MKRICLAVPLGVFLFVGCVVGPGYRGSGMRDDDRSRSYKRGHDERDRN